MSALRAGLLTAVALVAFAANSLLCRAALGEGVIDPVSFTSLRLASGALILLPFGGLARARAESSAPAASAAPGSWRSGLWLFAYALAFSLAYRSLSAGTGALVLFGAVQITMLTAALAAGERLEGRQWVGLLLAVLGLVYLLLPGLEAPDPVGLLLMTVSGAAWGLYTIAGREASRPVRRTAGNFLRAAPMAVAVSAVAWSTAAVEARGLALAVVSGAVTSGLGYVVWYACLPSLTTTQASVVQLLVPVIAAVGGVALLAEEVTPRLVVAGALILGGVATAVLVRRAPPTPRRPRG